MFPRVFGDQRYSPPSLANALHPLKPDGRLRRIAGITARYFRVPVALIHPTDSRLAWIPPVCSGKPKYTEREIALCAQAFLVGEVLAVPDTLKDPRLAGDPLVTGTTAIRFGAGIPLLDSDGTLIGGLCILDRRPRPWTGVEEAALREFAEVCENELRIWLALLRTAGDPAAFAATEQRYRELFENVTDVVYTHDLGGRFTEVNRAAEAISGYSRDELTAMTITDLVVPEHGDLARQMILEQFGGGFSSSYELDIRTKHGDCVTLEISTHLLFDRGQPFGLMGFGRNVTGRKLETTARRQAEEKLLLLTGELVRFSSHLQQLHRLSTTSYERLEDLFADYLRTGREILGATMGMITKVEGQRCIILAMQSDAENVTAGLDIALEDTCLVPLDASGTTFRYVAEKPAAGVPTFRTQGASCVITAPIGVDGNLYGLLCFATRAARVPLSPQEKDILELMARSISRFVLDVQVRSERERIAAMERDRNLVLEMVTQNHSLEASLTQLIRMVERQRPGWYCSVLLLEDGCLHAVAAPSLPQEYLRIMQRLPVSPAGGFCAGQTYWGSIQRTEILPAGEPWDAHREILQSLNAVQCGSTPIRSGSGELLGVLALYAAASAPYDDSVRELHEMAGRLISIAIEHQRLTDRLAHQALHDGLTGLPNRTVLIERLERMLGSASASGGQLAVALVDLDRFKQINDTFGHPGGDKVLQQIALRLRRCLRSDDCLARVGGDEFGVMLTHLTGPGEAAALSRMLLESVRAPLQLDGHELFITASIGISVHPRDGGDAAALLRNAASAMYQVKSRGKNDLDFCRPDSRLTSSQRLELHSYLHRALDRHEFQLFFQPQVELNGKLHSLEVLLAWNHPKLGKIPAGQFIPVAEESGLIVPIGSWVLRQACFHNAAWQRAGHPPVKLAVNVSALQFGRPDFVEVVAAALRDSGLAPGYLDLELTESLVMRDFEESVRRMALLRGLGLSLSIDDFGTGYSSLSYLRRLPVDSLKIDRSFLQETESAAGAMSLIETIVMLAHNMGLRVVGEGVETSDQLELLAHAGCDTVQGHLFGPLLNVQQAEQLLRRPRNLLRGRRKRS